MLSDIGNVRQMLELLDDGFVDALSGAEELVEDVDETLDRVTAFVAALVGGATPP
jgi:hypothetical protein